MKVKFKYGIKSYSGTLDEMTYGSYNDGDVCIGRKYVKPETTDNNLLMGDIMQNLADVYKKSSEFYRNDLYLFSRRNAKQNVPKGRIAPNGYALFLAMMYAWAADNPSTVDLLTIDIEDIQSTTAPVNRVADAIDNGYLPRVREYSDLISEM